MSIPKNSNLIPAICEINWALLDDVDSITATPDRFHRQIAFKCGKNWQEIYFTPGSIEFTEKSKDTDAGELIEQSLKFMFPGEDTSNMAVIDALLNRPVLVGIGYSTGMGKIMGDIGNGAKLSQVMQVSSKTTGSQLEFTCLANYRSPWVTP